MPRRQPFAEPPPPSFDPVHYRAENPDLTALTDAEGMAHFRTVGRHEGRVASAPARREAIVVLASRARTALEIGPFCAPLLRGEGVEYLDILSAPQLCTRARELGLDPAGCPPLIHHVGDLATIDRRYHAILSSHALEHQPDLVRHLQQVARVLEPDGRYFLIVPDKRYCFDHFLGESSIADVLEAWHEERRCHSIGRVVEHGALATHNDPVRHWAGDHGVVDPIDQARRIREAMACYDDAGGRYLDVHGWYFTPNGLRAILGGLSELGLSAFDATIYDTPRDRAEFTAILERRRPARLSPSRRHMMDILFFQTADPFRYAPMLSTTAPNVTEYCRRHGYRYESYVGIKRGYWNWQASYNRILQYRELIERGFQGWAIYLDADAWVHDLDFDLPAYLATHHDRAAILATAGVTGEHWDINDGVMLVNLGHPQGRLLIERWHAAFQAIDDARLQAAETWIDTGNDQDLIQTVLRDTPEIADAVYVESMDVINSRDAHFIRQHLRAQTPNIDARISAIAQDVATVAAADGRMTSATPAATDRWSTRLMHPPRAEPQLVQHQAARIVDDVLAARIIAAWRSSHDASEPTPQQRDLVALLDDGDPAALLDLVRTFGRSDVAQGLLGGARQHDRARNPVFARRLALSTHDMLISLAEAVGALPVEDPEAGSWNANVGVTAATLVGRVQDALNIELAPPPSLGLYLGIAAGDGLVLHQRFVEAILAAWRLRAVVNAANVGARVCELGAGLGLTAFYAARLGLVDYMLLDHSALTAVQSVLLGRMTGYDMVLVGEEAGTPAFRPRPTTALAGLDAGSIDVLFAREAFSDIPPDKVTELLLQGRRAGARRFLAMDRELPEADRPRLTDLAQAAGWRRIHRHRHWLRKGHVEELFVPD